MCKLASLYLDRIHYIAPTTEPCVIYFLFDGFGLLPMDSTLEPLPQFLTSNPSKPSAVATILHNLAHDIPESHPIQFSDTHDNFRFHQFSDRENVLRKEQGDIQSTGYRSIIICPDGRLPERHLMPSFDLAVYYQALSEARKGNEIPDQEDAWSIGDVVLYGEMVTSTQTMLEKYVLDRVGTTALHDPPIEIHVYFQS
jgi:hypothetical protein